MKETFYLLFIKYFLAELEWRKRSGVHKLSRANCRALLNILHFKLAIFGFFTTFLRLSWLFLHLVYTISLYTSWENTSCGFLLYCVYFYAKVYGKRSFRKPFMSAISISTIDNFAQLSVARRFLDWLLFCVLASK